MKSMKTASGAFVLASALLLTGCSGGSSDDKGDDSKKTTNTSLQTVSYTHLTLPTICSV